jgi:hypothetical protein
VIGYKLAVLAVLLFVVVGCAIDALFRRRNERISISVFDGSNGDCATSFDCGSGDSGGGD